MNIEEILNKAVKKFIKEYHLGESACKSLQTTLKKMEVQFRTNGNFTVAILTQKNGNVFVGVAKRNPTDAIDTERGQTIALHRAFAEAASSLV